MYARIVPIRRKRIILEGVGGTTALGAAGEDTSTSAGQAALLLRAMSLATNALPDTIGPADVDARAKLILLTQAAIQGIDAVRAARDNVTFSDAFIDGIVIAISLGFLGPDIPTSGNVQTKLDFMRAQLSIFLSAMQSVQNLGGVTTQKQLLRTTFAMEADIFDQVSDLTELPSAFVTFKETLKKIPAAIVEVTEAIPEAARGAFNFIDTLTTVAIVGFGAYILSTIMKKPAPRRRTTRRYR